MDKKLPSVFANKIEKRLNNNNSIFYGKEENRQNNQEKKFDYLNEKSLASKIDSIFTSKNYVYKANVVLTTKSGKLNKTIIGRNKDNLITIDNELVNITNIIDIELQ